eukprot:TRINITY_DN2012_c1_g1_i1.p1 TRINITY_DN2012_c1_g1~~TRINITY_DN2012_c1_g1_i1.p1  ORF type:complete len:383 (+),score=101.86 TRINITY_DN2012_c1_g1_i1:29-1150(+)
MQRKHPTPRKDPSSASAGGLQSAYASLLRLPYDWYDTFMEDFLTEYDSWSPLMAWSLIFALNIILVATKLNLVPNGWQLIVGIALLLISVANCFRFFTATKTYQLFHISREKANNNPSIQPMHMTAAHGEPAKQMYELNKWTPSEFNTFIFCYFSPLQVAIIMAGDSTNASSLLFHLCLGFLAMACVAFLVHRFVSMTRDQSLLHAEAYDEFNRFAASRIQYTFPETQPKPPTTPSNTSFPASPYTRTQPSQQQHNTSYYQQQQQQQQPQQQQHHKQQQQQQLHHQYTPHATTPHHTAHTISPPSSPSVYSSTPVTTNTPDYSYIDSAQSPTMRPQQQATKQPNSGSGTPGRRRVRHVSNPFQKARLHKNDND